MAKRRLAFGVLGALLGVFATSGCEREKAPPAPDATSQRTITTGDVVGFVGDYGSHVWRGIPYAKPPVGNLRWRAPQPPDAWSGTREALAFGSACTQYASPLGGVTDAKPGTPTGSEDCLYANVYTPHFTPDAVPQGSARLPVMLWIHGGGNTIGEGAFYNGGNLAVSDNVVVVTFNYRLGPFGWFRHGALRAGALSEEDGSGNFGNLDLIRALEWVRNNIGAFGGNPDNVTIFGESAGGQNVYSLLLSPKAKGLFHRAIAQSGGLWFSTNAEGVNLTTAKEPGDKNSSNEVLLRLLIADDLAADRRAAIQKLNSMSAAEVSAYLHSKSNFEIIDAYDQWESTGMIDLPESFREGVVLPKEDPRELLALGRYNKVPVMVGTTRDENKLFMFFNPEYVRRTLWVFWRLRDERMYNLIAEYRANWWKAEGADEPATSMRAAQGPSVYVYRFDWDEEPTVLGADLSVMLGASHGFEIPFVFGHFDLGHEGSRLYTAENEAGRQELSDKMMSYWTAFAYNGDPGGGRNGDLPQWTAWENSTPEEAKFIVLDTEAGGGVRMSPDALTRAGVLAGIDTDPRLAAPQDKCTVLRALIESSRAIDKSEYARRCPEYPFDEYPWGG